MTVNLVYKHFFKMFSVCTAVITEISDKRFVENIIQKMSATADTFGECNLKGSNCTRLKSCVN